MDLAAPVCWAWALCCRDKWKDQTVTAAFTAATILFTLTVTKAGTDKASSIATRRVLTRVLQPAANFAPVPW